MEWRHIGSREYENISFETMEYKSEFVHIFRPSGILPIKERAAVYAATLELTRSDCYLAILDNRKGREISLTGQHISFFVDFLAEKGIHYIAYAVVTNDPGYADIIKLFKAIAEAKDIALEAISTPSFEAAKAFVAGEIDRLAAIKQRPRR
ncbi:hypothetical protein [Sneathiella sp.]|uniref:hypothetical protein n=1 Tax=Sneathiella sp. TaxID=1964365 RepID=UPI002FE00C38